MNKEFIPYQQALELKELGFDEPCFGYYENQDKKLVIHYNNLPLTEGQQKRPNLFKIDNRNSVLSQWATAVPTYSQAFRWFRDKKLADGSVSRHGEADGGYSYRWDILYEYGVYEERHFKLGYKTYEEAELSCLKEMIEIVKQK